MLCTLVIVGKRHPRAGDAGRAAARDRLRCLSLLPTLIQISVSGWARRPPRMKTRHCCALIRRCRVAKKVQSFATGGAAINGADEWTAQRWLRNAAEVVTHRPPMLSVITSTRSRRTASSPGHQSGEGSNGDRRAGKNKLAQAGQLAQDHPYQYGCVLRNGVRQLRTFA
jgi:hypothetical protein